MAFFDLIPGYGFVEMPAPDTMDLVPAYGFIINSEDDEDPSPSGTNPPIMILVM